MSFLDPDVENHSVERAHQIGRTRDVAIHRIFVPKTSTISGIDAVFLSCILLQITCKICYYSLLQGLYSPEHVFTDNDSGSNLSEQLLCSDLSLLVIYRDPILNSREQPKRIRHRRLNGRCCMML